MQSDDRRQFQRVTVKRPAKVLCEATGRYLAAITVDISLGGMLVMSPGRQSLPAGLDVVIGVATDASDALIRRETMRRGKVVRSAMTDHGTYTAIALAKPMTLPEEAEIEQSASVAA